MGEEGVKTILVIAGLLLLLCVSFGIGVIASPRVHSLENGQLVAKLSQLGRNIDYWASRYQTFLGVLVAIAVAYFTLSAASRQTSVSERQFLSTQMQGLMGDKNTLQLVISQLNEALSQKEIFRHNLTFLDSEGDKTTGWLNANNHLRTSYSNVEVFRALISQNTARFLGPTPSREQLIAKLDTILNSQEQIRNDFLKWATLNRTVAADPAAPDSVEKTAYLHRKEQTIALWDEFLPLAKKVADDLHAKIGGVDRDMEELRAAIQSKQPRG